MSEDPQNPFTPDAPNLVWEFTEKGAMSVHGLTPAMVMRANPEDSDDLFVTVKHHTTTLGASEKETLQAWEIIQGLAEALDFYGNPETYHAVGVIGDPPCGDFYRDYSEDHGHPDYDGARYGKTAREAINKAKLLRKNLPEDKRSWINSEVHDEELRTQHERDMRFSEWMWRVGQFMFHRYQTLQEAFQYWIDNVDGKENQNEQ